MSKIIKIQEKYEVDEEDEAKALQNRLQEWKVDLKPKLWLLGIKPKLNDKKKRTKITKSGVPRRYLRGGTHPRCVADLEISY